MGRVPVWEKEEKERLTTTELFEVTLNPFGLGSASHRDLVSLKPDRF